MYQAPTETGKYPKYTGLKEKNLPEFSCRPAKFEEPNRQPNGEIVNYQSVEMIGIKQNFGVHRYADGDSHLEAQDYHILTTCLALIPPPSLTSACAPPPASAQACSRCLCHLFYP